MALNDKNTISIITPCTRINNLPIILSRIENIGVATEWIIVYDENFVKEMDTKILMYPSVNTTIKLFLSDNDPSSGNAWRLRNIGIDNATGDYLYFLDDDTVPHPNLYYGVKNYLYKYDLIVFNQSRRGRTLKNDYFKHPHLIDTGQFLVARDKTTKWGPSTDYREERGYFSTLLGSISKDKIIYLQIPLSYYNHLSI